jgi:cellulose synthase/poly-beta-1,6-N-acetylglucosamine synthase-like glycosyltransferase
MLKTFSVIVPVFNEENGLAARAGLLLSGLPGGCELIFVCNGCTDRSEAILRETVGTTAVVLTCAKGKARAIRLGERHASLLPRFYVDSDVSVSGSDLARLARALRDGVQLVSPRIAFNLEGASWAARSLSQFWLSLPHGRTGAYHHVLGVSAAARARWGAFPDLMADDLFIESMIEDEEKRVVTDITVTTTPPKRFWQWIRVRIRWQQGIEQLRRARIDPPMVAGQYRAILSGALSPRLCASAILYCASVLLSRLLARTGLFESGKWYRDASSR